MPIFRYEVLDKYDKTLRGAMDAATPEDVTQRLTARGYRNVQVLSPSTSAIPNTSQAAPAQHLTGGVRPTTDTPLNAPTPSSRTPAGTLWVGPRLSGSANPEDLAPFFRQMASLIHAGFSVSSALMDLGPRTPHRTLSIAAKGLANATAQGASLAQQMRQYPGLFPAHVVGLVAAGEQGGFLEFSFEEAGLWAEQEVALRQGMGLPRFLTWQAIWSVLLFQPLFPSLMIADAGFNFAGSIGKYFKTLLFICLPIGIAIHLFALLLSWWRKQPGARPFFDALSLRLPVAAKFSRMQALAAFTRVLRRLLMAGISPEPAFIGAANAAPNSVLREQLLRGAPLLRAGQGLDAAVQATGLLDADPLNRLITGQRTGQWQEMLEQVTSYYQDEAARAMEGIRSAQRRVGVILTLVSSGYVTIVATHGLATLGFKFTESFAGNE